MKFIIAMIMLTQNAYAMREGPPDTRTPLEKQSIEYSRRFFLDKLTFDAHQIERINLDRWTSGDRFGWGTEYKLEGLSTREGLVLELSAKGQAADVETLFNGLLTDIISVLYTKGGWLWSLPSPAYKSYWNSEVGQTVTEIRQAAFKQWARTAKPSDAEFRKACEALL